MWYAEEFVYIMRLNQSIALESMVKSHIAPESHDTPLFPLSNGLCLTLTQNNSDRSKAVHRDFWGPMRDLPILLGATTLNISNYKQQ